MSVCASLAAIVGSKNVLTDPLDLHPYLEEERGLVRGTALAVVRPGSTQEVAAVVAACAQAGVAMVPQGGNTGLCGGGVPHGNAVVVSTERLTRIRAIDPLDFSLVAEAGCILATVQAAAEAHDRLFPLSLGAEGSCRIGGNLSTNAGGIAVLRYGNARDLVLGLEVVLPDGRIWEGLRALRKDNTGYDLKHLFIGAEGTLGIITAAVLKLFPLPKERETMLVALPQVEAALALMAEAQVTAGDALTACEIFPRIALDLGLAHCVGVRDPFSQTYPWYLLLEVSSARVGGVSGILESVSAQALSQGHALDGVLAQSESQRKALWRLREAIPEAQKREGASIKHDVAVPLHRVPEMIRRCHQAVVEALPGVRPVPFGHMGDGNIHFNLSQPVGADPQAFLAEWGRMNRIVHTIVVEMGGTISAEHGIGQRKIAELERTKSAVELDLMRRIKAALDPKGHMNPGKIFSDSPFG